MKTSADVRKLHHIVPRSRGGSDDAPNRYPLARWGDEYHRKHGAWHVLFSNLTPREIVEVLKAHAESNGGIADKFFQTSFAVKEGLIDGSFTEWIECKRDKSDKKKIQKRKDAWLLIFENMSARNAIEWIESEFIRRKWFYAS